MYQNLHRAALALPVIIFHAYPIPNACDMESLGTHEAITSGIAARAPARVAKRGNTTFFPVLTARAPVRWEPRNIVKSFVTKGWCMCATSYQG